MNARPWPRTATTKISPYILGASEDGAPHDRNLCARARASAIDRGVTSEYVGTMRLGHPRISQINVIIMKDASGVHSGSCTYQKIAHAASYLLFAMSWIKITRDAFGK